MPATSTPAFSQPLRSTSRYISPSAVWMSACEARIAASSFGSGRDDDSSSPAPATSWPSARRFAIAAATAARASLAAVSRLRLTSASALAAGRSSAAW